MDDTQEVTLRLNARTLRKIKALHTLSGGHDFEDALERMLERAVDEEILSYIERPELRRSMPVQMPPRRKAATAYDDPTGLSSGLGDEDPSPPEPVAMDEAIPQTGLTDEEIDNDMMLDDPAHEAKGDAASVEMMGMSAEDDFARITGIPIPLVDRAQEAAVLARRRRKPLKLRGKVTAFTDSMPEEERL